MNPLGCCLNLWGACVACSRLFFGSPWEGVSGPLVRDGAVPVSPAFPLKTEVKPHVLDGSVLPFSWLFLEGGGQAHLSSVGTGLLFSLFPFAKR